ncbi:MAG: CinA family protein [Anaerolineae bacterium]
MDTFQLATAVGEQLRARGWRLAVAESCTGGLVGHWITEVAGSSDYFLGGVIAYSNQAKEQLLGVHPSTLLQHGAVSEATAREMAAGVRRLLGADVALAVTGIAGPGGGTTEKPVGLVYIALDAPDHQTCRRHVWDGDRAANKAQSAHAALALLRDYLVHL